MKRSKFKKLTKDTSQRLRELHDEVSKATCLLCEEAVNGGKAESECVDTMVFDKPLVLVEKNNQIITADRIVWFGTWCERSDSLFYLLYMGDALVVGHCFLSIGNLITVYEFVKKQVRRYVEK